MDIATLLPWAIFGAITLGLWAVMSIFSGKENRATDRLEELKNPMQRADKNRSQKKGMAAMIEQAAPAL